MLAAAGLAVMVIVRAAANHEDWFRQWGSEGALADLFFMGTPFLIVFGAGGSPNLSAVGASYAVNRGGSPTS
jgi:uncharacterized membrane protein YphA (DoxX/SURF4 family)